MMDRSWLYRKTKQAIDHRIEKNTWPMSYLLPLKQDLGGHELAGYIIRQLFCHQQSSSCASMTCERIDNHEHPDLITIKADDSAAIPHIKIDQLRSAIQRIATSPSLGDKQVIYIENCEYMTEQCANALLKTLEEPKDGLYLILQTDMPKRLLPTILSRLFIEVTPIEQSAIDAFIHQKTTQHTHYAFLQYTHTESLAHIESAVKDNGLFSLYESVMTMLSHSRWQPLTMSEKLEQYSVQDICDTIIQCLGAICGELCQITARERKLYHSLVGVMNIKPSKTLSPLKQEKILQFVLKIKKLLLRRVTLNASHLKAYLFINIWQCCQSNSKVTT